MRKAAIGIPVFLTALSGLLAFRVHAQGARAHAPSSGSATVEGVETVVGARIAGRVVDVLVPEGARVVRGQPLVKIDCASNEAALALATARLQSAEAQVAVLTASVSSASDAVAVARAQAAAAHAQARALAVEKEKSERDFGRASKLGAEGAISVVEVENTSSKLRGVEEQLGAAHANGNAAELGSRATVTNVRVATANVGVALAAVEAARADERRAALDVAECTVLAPSDGTVTARIVEPGAVVMPGTRLLTTLALAHAKVTFFLPNAELARAAIGNAADVHVDAYPTRVFHGSVARIASEAEFTPRNVQTREDRDRLVFAVEIDVDNGDGALRAGMPADVVLVGTAR